MGDQDGRNLHVRAGTARRAQKSVGPRVLVSAAVMPIRNGDACECRVGRRRRAGARNQSSGVRTVGPFNAEARVCRAAVVHRLTVPDVNADALERWVSLGGSMGPIARVINSGALADRGCVVTWRTANEPVFARRFGMRRACLRYLRARVAPDSQFIRCTPRIPVRRRACRRRRHLRPAHVVVAARETVVAIATTAASRWLTFSTILALTRAAAERERHELHRGNHEPQEEPGVAVRRRFVNGAHAKVRFARPIVSHDGETAIGVPRERERRGARSRPNEVNAPRIATLRSYDGRRNRCFLRTARTLLGRWWCDLQS